MNLCVCVCVCINHLASLYFYLAISQSSLCLCLCLASHRKLSRVCALFNAYSGECTWKAIGDRLQQPHYLSRVDHERKIRSRRQRMDIGKYSFVNRTIQHWNQLPAVVLGILPCKTITFKRRVRKVIIELN